MSLPSLKYEEMCLTFQLFLKPVTEPVINVHVHLNLDLSSSPFLTLLLHHTSSPSDHLPSSITHHSFIPFIYLPPACHFHSESFFQRCFLSPPHLPPFHSPLPI